MNYFEIAKRQAQLYAEIVKLREILTRVPEDDWKNVKEVLLIKEQEFKALEYQNEKY